MHMHDWNTYRQQLFAGVGELGKLSPDTVRGYMALGGAGEKTGHLDAKTRELIALAVAISLRCDGCITVHSDALTESYACCLHNLKSSSFRSSYYFKRRSRRQTPRGFNFNLVEFLDS